VRSQDDRLAQSGRDEHDDPREGSKTEWGRRDSPLPIRPPSGDYAPLGTVETPRYLPQPANLPAVSRARPMTNQPTRNHDRNDTTASHHTPGNSLRDVPIWTGYQMFLDMKRGEIKDSSLRDYEVAIRLFCEYIEDQGVTYLYEIDGFLLEQYKAERKKTVKQITVHNHWKKLRVFIRYVESINGIERGLAAVMTIPSVSRTDEVNDEFIDPDLNDAIQNYYEQVETASRGHAAYTLMWHTGCRVSGIVSLDVDDLQYDEESDVHYINFRDREDEGTPLKNGEKSERAVAIHDQDVLKIVQAYLNYQRRPQTDDHGREPMFTTTHGRGNRDLHYKAVKKVTRPCRLFGDGCPVDKNPETCDAAQYVSKAHECPPSYSTHPIRKGSITYQLAIGYPKPDLSERCDVTVPVLEKHYDKRTEKIKMQVRARHGQLFNRTDAYRTAENSKSFNI
jgi:site-specific recombinase XerD